MQNIQGFDFFPLHFDGSGNLPDPSEMSDLAAAAGSASDTVIFAHGFRNDENDATRLYTNFLTTFRGHLTRPEFQALTARKIVAAGVYWPSKPYKEVFPSAAPAGSGSVQSNDDTLAQQEQVRLQLEDLRTDVDAGQRGAIDQAIALLPQLDDDLDAQDRFVSLLLSVLPSDDTDPNEGLDVVRSIKGSDLLAKLSQPFVVPLVQAASAGGGTDFGGGVSDFGSFASTGGGTVESFGSVFGSILGGAGKIANSSTWYLMKSRSGVVGETGVTRVVRALKTSLPELKVHLVGHSLGGRLMAACGRALGQAPTVQPASMTLLEAAFSHYGFSANNGAGGRGFFRDVIEKNVVKGPLLETFSAQDTVVGQVYAIVSRLATDNTKAIGDATDSYGGIGRNGSQKTPESAFEPLHTVGNPYTFKSGIVTNLDGSGGLITSHGDVTNDNVTYAFASAFAAT
jgi:hypothetical protein